LNTTTEIHALFGVTNLSTFINTQSKNYEPVSEIITVDPSFSFTDFSKQVYIYNKTQNYDVKMSQKGEDPHGIMIPSDFAYPREKVCIKDAYTQFNSWGENPITSTDWYLTPVEGKVMNAFTK
jgi:LruC domain-containing protein